MKKILPVFIISLIYLYALPLFSQIANGNIYITNDTTWNNTITLDGNVFIDSNVTLTVMPGTFINITGYYAFYCHGTIKAIGTKAQPVTFTHLNTNYHNDTSTTKGGWHGIRLLACSANDTSVFEYCRITNGKAVVPGTWQANINSYPDNRGANIYGIDFGNLIIKNSYIGNGISKGDGGGVYLENGQYALIDSSHFKDNRCYFDFGGGACLRFIDRLTVTNNLFNYNTAYNVVNHWASGAGAAFAALNAMDYDAYAEIVNNRLFNNFTNSGILYDSYYYSKVSNNIICNNFGAGIFDANLYNYPVYSNNTIANNSANTWAGTVIFSSNAVFINNIIWNNKNNMPQIKWCYHCDPPVIKYTDIMLGYPGQGNMDIDPKFIDPTFDIGIEYDALEADWSLRDDSPLVNAGIPDTTGWNIPATDLYGNPRIYGTRIDIGAIENQNVLVSNPNIQAKQTAWVIYPNPVQNEFYIKNNMKTKNAFITLYDITGKVLKKAAIDNHSTVSVKQIKPGIYFYKIMAENKLLKTGKWIKM